VLSPGVITAYKAGRLGLIPDILDIDVFKVTNISAFNLPLDDLLLRPNEFGWVEGVDVNLLSAWQRGWILIEPNPFDVPVYDGTVIPSPVGGGGSDSNFQTSTNDDSVALTIGTPVYSQANNLMVRRAQGNNIDTKSVWGLVASTSANPGDDVEVCLGGVLSASVGAWNSVTGLGGGLVLRAPYYLSTSTPGRITPFAPSPIPGEDLWSIQIGYAINNNQLKVEIQQSVKL
jgi:hypothetical protein